MTAILTAINFTEWGNQVSRDFMDNGESMNSTISKIASDNELSPLQIQRICEIANHSTYAQMYKEAEDKTFDFELADTDGIMQKLSAGGSDTPVDYLVPPQSTREAVDVNKIFGISTIGNEPEIGEKIKVAMMVKEKLEMAKEGLEAQKTSNQRELLVTIDEFGKMAKQMVMGGVSIIDIHSVARDAWDDDRATALVAKTAASLANEGIYGAKIECMLKAGEAVEEDKISDKLKSMSKPIGVKVVNGNHPIYTTINTIGGLVDKDDHLRRAQYLLDQKASHVNQAVTDLNNSKVTDAFVVRNT